ncbi:MAG: hypothetical protein KatS3mg056_0722 [Chloroflexus sp.]|jgi:hypothetical protein|nr:MAG: hypothetical protein KatS3mg056_0722 [Chloroflexus sp.]
MAIVVASWFQWGARRRRALPGDGRLAQALSTPEARAPRGWQAGAGGEHAGGARSQCRQTRPHPHPPPLGAGTSRVGMAIVVASWFQWGACRRRALPGEWQAGAGSEHARGARSQCRQTRPHPHPPPLGAGTSGGGMAIVVAGWFQWGAPRRRALLGDGRLVQVVSEPEARAPSASRHAPTLTRPRWGREPAVSEWLSLSRAGSSGERPGGARSQGIAGWCRWRACRRRALPGEWQALVPQYDT